MGSKKMEEWRNPTLPLEVRVEQLLDALSPEEKCGFLSFNSPGVERLGIPPYNAWNEGMHGVSRAGIATVFPQPIGMAASFDPELLARTAAAIGDEFRAKHHEALRQGDHGIYKGLTVWSPNINIFRDPRWGRGHETYGEDPYLTSVMAIAFIKALQGWNGNHFKCIATVKHFAVHSGPEPKRHSFDAKVSPQDLVETYLPAFRAAVREADVQSVMTAYNRINGIPASAHTMLDELLRETWGFSGFVVSDCGAISDMHRGHGWSCCDDEAAAAALEAGCDMECDFLTSTLLSSWSKGRLSGKSIDRALRRVLRGRFLLGQFDPPDSCEWERIPYERVDAPEHRLLAKELAQKSIVLLKNRKGILPLRPGFGAIAMIGPNADDRDVLLGNYHGTPSKVVTPLEGLRTALSPEVKLYYSPGCPRSSREDAAWGNSDKILFSEAASMAQRSDLVIMVLGLGPDLEGEEGDTANSDGGGDRTNLSLPGFQEELFFHLHNIGKPIIVVLVHGGPISFQAIFEEADGVIDLWYPGEEGGTALAEVLLGKANPAGRLPVTSPYSVNDLPAFDSYAMEGRSYRYMNREAFLPFGFGLSYTSFTYKLLSFDPSFPHSLAVLVKNVGDMDGEELVQLYVAPSGQDSTPFRRTLKRFHRIMIPAGEGREVRFTLEEEDFLYADLEGTPQLLKGSFKLIVAGSQNDQRSLDLGASPGLEIEIHL
jgi:beta-glucosidase